MAVLPHDLDQQNPRDPKAQSTETWKNKKRDLRPEEARRQSSRARGLGKENIEILIRRQM